METINAMQALTNAGLNFGIMQSESASFLFFDKNGKEFRVATDERKMILRDDTFAPIGINGGEYVATSPRDIANDADSLVELSGGKLTVENAIGFYNGRKVAINLKSINPFVVKNSKGVDIVHTRLNFGNGTDGKTPHFAACSSFRAICLNTFLKNLALAMEQGNTLRHSGNMDNKRAALVSRLASYFVESSAIENDANTLASIPVKSAQQIQEFWTRVYSELEGEIVTNPKNGHESRKTDRAIFAMRRMSATFDKESQEFGASAWIAANAITEWYDHAATSTRQRTDEFAADRAMDDKLFGKVAQRKQRVMELALQLA